MTRRDTKLHGSLQLRQPHFLKIKIFRSNSVVKWRMAKEFRLFRLGFHARKYRSVNVSLYYGNSIKELSFLNNTRLYPVG